MTIYFNSFQQQDTTCGVTAGPSYIPHSKAGNRCFGTQQFLKENSIGFYYGRPVSKNMSAVSDENMYDEGMITVPAFNFCGFAIYFHRKPNSFDGQKYHIWLVSTKLNEL